MKKYLIFSLLAMLVSATIAQTYPSVKNGKLSSFRLDNGLNVILIRNDSMDENVVRLLVDRPLVAERQKAGLAELTERLLLSGTQTRSRAEIEQALADWEASLIMEDRVVEGKIAEARLPQFLKLLAEVVRRPAFAPTEFEQVKAELLEREKALASKPAYIVKQLTEQLVFGADHPYGERRSTAAWQNIELADVRSFHETYYRPVIAHLAIVTNADSAALREQIVQHFGDWKVEKAMFARFFNPAPLPERTRYSFANVPEAETASIQMGYAYRLLPRADAALAVRLLEAILQKHLTKLPWWPEAGEVILSSDPQLGQLRVAFTVPTQRAAPAIRQIRDLMYQLRSDSTGLYLGLGPTKKTVVDTIRKNLITGAGQAREGTGISRYKLPLTEYGIDRGRIRFEGDDNALYAGSRDWNYGLRPEGSGRVVDNKTIRQAARDYLIPGRMQVVVVGNRSLIPELQAMAAPDAVHFYNADGEALIAATPSVVTERRDAAAIIARYVKAIGGSAQLLRVKDLRTVFESELQGVPFVKTDLRTQTGRWWQQSKIGEVLMDKTVVNGSFVRLYRGLIEQSLTEQEQAKLREEAGLFPELAYTKKGYQLEVSGSTRIAGAVVDEVTITSPSGRVRKDYFDQRTGLRVRSVEGVGEDRLVREFLDYRPQKGILFPHQVIYTGLTEEPLSFQLKSVVINAGMDEKLFE